MAEQECYLAVNERRKVTQCNHNFSKEGIYHPDRTLNEYDLLYMQEGIWDIREDNQIFHVEPNTILVLEPGKHHKGISLCQPNMRNMYVHFSVLKGDGEASSQNLCLKKLTDCTKNRFISHYMEQIIETFWSSSSPLRELRLSALLDMLLTEIAGENGNPVSTSDVMIEEIIHRFHNHPGCFFGVEELANSYHVSERTLSSRFKKATGQTVHQYQLTLKCNMAYDMLPLNPGRGLRDIAVSLGFYDEFQFSKLFKRQFGISPSERRNSR